MTTPSAKPQIVHQEAYDLYLALLRGYFATMAIALGYLLIRGSMGEFLVESEFMTSKDSKMLSADSLLIAFFYTFPFAIGAILLLHRKATLNHWGNYVLLFFVLCPLQYLLFLMVFVLSMMFSSIFFPGYNIFDGAM